MQLEPSLFLHHLDAFDMSHEEKVDYLHQLWRIAHYFADQAFGLTSEQILLGVDGTKCGVGAQDALDSADQIQATFNSAALVRAGGKSDS